MIEPESSAEMRDALRNRIKLLEAEKAELERIRQSAIRIYETNEAFHWRLVDLFDPTVRGVSALHYLEEQIKELQAESELRAHMQAERDAAMAECDLLRKCFNTLEIGVRNACTVLGGELFLGQDAKDKMYYAARKTHDFLRKLVDDVDSVMGGTK